MSVDYTPNQQVIDIDIDPWASDHQTMSASSLWLDIAPSEKDWSTQMHKCMCTKQSISKNWLTHWDFHWQEMSVHL